MPPIRVSTPDGKIAEFPEGTDPKLIEGALQRQFNPTYGQRFQQAFTEGDPRESSFGKFTNQVAPFMAIPGGPGWAGLARQALMSGGLGAAKAAKEGKPAAELPLEAGKEVVGTVVGRGLGNVAGRAVQAATPLVQKAEAWRIGRQIGQAMPEMETQGGKQLYKFVKEGGGEAIRKDLISDMKHFVGARLGGQTVNIPALAKQPLTFEQAIDELEKLGDRAFPRNVHALSLEDTQRVKEAARAYGEARRELPRQLDMLSKGAGDLFDQTYKRAAAQGAYLQLMEDAIDPKTGRLMTEKVMAKMNDAPEHWKTLLGPYYDQVSKVLLRGQGTPAIADQPLKATSPYSWLHGLVSPRYKAGGGVNPPMGQGALTQALGGLGGGYPGPTIGLGALAAEAAKEHIPGIRRQGEGFGGGEN